MNTKGVEDGISDEEAVIAERPTAMVWPPSGGNAWRIAARKPHSADWEVIGYGVDVGPAWSDARSRLPRTRPAAVPEAPTFAYQLAMYLTRNGADAPHMQAEINRFLYDGKWQTTQGAK